MEYVEGSISFNCGGDFIIISPKHYENVNANGSDKDWVITEIYVKAGVFEGRYRASMRTIDFEFLKIGLNKCNTNFKSSFDLETLEDGIELKVVGDGLGHFSVRGICSCKNAELHFEMEFDQTNLNRMVNEINIITSKYPYDNNGLKFKS